MLAPRVMKSSIVADAKNPIGKICEIITGYIEQNQLENVEAISIGVPSSVENDKETVICTTNIRNRAGEVVFFPYEYGKGRQGAFPDSRIYQ